MRVGDDFVAKENVRHRPKTVLIVVYKREYTKHYLLDLLFL